MGSVFTNNSAETLGRVWGMGWPGGQRRSSGHYVDLIGGGSRLLSASTYVAPYGSWRPIV